MLSILTETQRAIVETVTMRLHVTQALQYLKDAGHEMSRAKYFRQKKKIEEMQLERMQYIAMHFQDQHIERIDKCELIEKLMWDNYHAEKDPTKKVSILGDIIDMQGKLAAYYDVTRYVLEKTVKTEADYFKQPRPYLFTDVREEREKEVKEEAEKSRFQIYNKREEEEARRLRMNADLEAINRSDPDITKETKTETNTNSNDSVNFATVQEVNDDNPPKKEQQPELETITEEEEEEEEEPIGRPWTKTEAYRAAAKVNKNNSNKTIFTS